jgi:hypothetical protein
MKTLYFKLILFGYLAVSGKKQRKEYEENIKLLTVENFKLIRDSPYADELSKYKIWREENKLRFTTEDGYTLFLLLLKKDEPNGVKLRGLDGYGIRDKEFLKYTCNLVSKIIEKNND